MHLSQPPPCLLNRSLKSSEHLSSRSAAITALHLERLSATLSASSCSLRMVDSIIDQRIQNSLYRRRTATSRLLVSHPRDREGGCVAKTLRAHSSLCRDLKPKHYRFHEPSSALDVDGLSNLARSRCVLQSFNQRLVQ